jgi:hypothetical protein
MTKFQWLLTVTLAGVVLAAATPALITTRQALTKGTPATALSAASSNGTSDSFARVDHTHGVSACALGQVLVKNVDGGWSCGQAALPACLRGQSPTMTDAGWSCGPALPACVRGKLPMMTDAGWGCAAPTPPLSNIRDNHFPEYSGVTVTDYICFADGGCFNQVPTTFELTHVRDVDGGSVDEGRGSGAAVRGGWLYAGHISTSTICWDHRDDGGIDVDNCITGKPPVGPQNFWDNEPDAGGGITVRDQLCFNGGGCYADIPAALENIYDIDDGVQIKYSGNINCGEVNATNLHSYGGGWGTQYVETSTSTAGIAMYGGEGYYTSPWLSAYAATPGGTSLYVNCGQTGAASGTDAGNCLEVLRAGTAPAISSLSSTGTWTASGYCFSPDGGCVTGVPGASLRNVQDVDGGVQITGSLSATNVSSSANVSTPQVCFTPDGGCMTSTPTPALSNISDDTYGVTSPAFRPSCLGPDEAAQGFNCDSTYEGSLRTRCAAPSDGGMVPTKLCMCGSYTLADAGWTWCEVGHGTSLGCTSVCWDPFST